MKVLIDTSFAVNAVRFRIDFIAGLGELLGTFKLLLPAPVLEELAELNAGKALEILKTHGYQITPSELGADDALVDFASKNDCVVCTQDTALKKRIKELGRRVLIIRDRHKIDFG